MRRFTIFLAAIVSLGCVGAAAADGDGQIAFNNHCRNCHSFKKGDNWLGPSIFGIFGASAGRVEGYGGYSGPGINSSTCFIANVYPSDGLPDGSS
jgi:cytochrome c2